jgi:hypothetical protein
MVKLERAGAGVGSGAGARSENFDQLYQSRTQLVSSATLLKHGHLQKSVHLR